MSAGILAGVSVGRISDRRSFVALRQPTQRVRRGPITVAWVRDDTRPGARVAYALSRQVGDAVVRNLIRRRLRAIFGEMAAALPAGSYLVSVAPQACGTSFADLRIWVGQAVDAIRAGAGLPR